MTISFTGDNMHDVMTQIKAFLFGEAGEAPKVETTPAVVQGEVAPLPPRAKPPYTAADVRKAFNEASQLTRPDGTQLIPRDTLRKALKDISGCDSLSAAPEESYAALIDWCKEAVSHAQ